MNAQIEKEWEDVSDSYGAQPGNYLLTTLRIDGYPMHLQALRVTDDGEQRAFDPAMQEELEEVYDLYDTAFVTTDLDGYEGVFVLHAVPFGD